MADADSGWKKRVYRLRGIPSTIQTHNEVTDLLGRGLGILDTNSILVCSLATMLNPWSESPLKVATVMLKRRPPLVADERGRNEWPITMEDTDDNLTLDSHFLHFLGLTPLCDVNPDHHVADCISISGLSSHPLGSWAAKGDDKRFMWIRDWIPNSLPTLRPIIYGYNTDIEDATSFQSIGDLARTFIDQLRANGWRTSSGHPLIFLAHSLGGIVLKDAIVQLANSGDPLDQCILHYVTGAVFFGVPNLGMQQSHFLSIIRGQPNEILIEDLSRDSTFLKNLDSAFQGICFTRKLKVFWGYETRQSPLTLRDENGILSRSGRSEILVTRFSATSRLVDQSLELTFAINEDHSNIVKFSRDSHYLNVVISKIDNILKCRQVQVAEGALPSAPWRSLDALNSDVVNPPIDGPWVAKEVIQSLDAPDLRSRQKEIVQRFEQTFDWIFKDIKFVEWACHGSGLFWISGKPGSGKSTLMKFLVDDHRSQQLLSSGLRRTSLVHAGFFFHYRGTAIQKSLEGLIKSVLRQLLEQQPPLLACIRRLLPLPKHPRQAFPPSFWTLAKLKEVLCLILDHQETPLDVCLFFDALDEYDGPPEAVCDFLHDIVHGSTHTNVNLKAVFSSRPWSVFKARFGDSAGLVLHEYTRNDIRDFCAGKIHANEEPLHLVLGLVPEIVHKSNGSFLWVRLLLENMLKQVLLQPQTSESFDFFQQILNDFPEELKDYYKQVISRLGTSHRMETYVLMELMVRGAGQSIFSTPQALLGAVRCAESRTWLEAQPAIMQTYEDFKTFENGIFIAQTLFDTWSGGLVELLSSPTLQGERVWYAQFMHQTVFDFAISLEFKELVLQNLSAVVNENGHSFAAKWVLSSCLSDGADSMDPTPTNLS